MPYPQPRSARQTREVFRKLFILIITAFVDMVGLLMVVPLMPFFARNLGAGSLMVTILVGSFTAAQLLSAPLWGRFSDRYGRKPALLVGLTAAAIAYVVFAFADSLWLLLLSRIVQGAGGGTVGVIQAYVADATEQKDRARALGWLSASTSVGVALGPALGSLALRAGGTSGPGLMAAALCILNIVFAWFYLSESRDPADASNAARKPGASLAAVSRVVTHSAEPASRLIWMYAITMGAFMGMNAILALFLADTFGMTADRIWIFYTYIGVISVITRAGILGRAVDRYGEAKLSRLGMTMLAVGLVTMPLAPNYGFLAVAIALIPLGTAFTFPCVTSLLSRVIPSRERGLYMGVQQSFGGIARIAVPLWSGFAYDRFGHSIPFFTSAALVVATIFLGLGLDDGRRAPIAAPEPEIAG